MSPLRHGTPSTSNLATTLTDLYHRLKLWGEGFGVAQGRLDERLKRSPGLREEILSLLESIGQHLSHRKSTRNIGPSFVCI